jgi:O-antigen/teichoic acid export membrane protein
LKNYKDIIKNLSYLSIVQLLNLVLPIITYPYLIRVLGTGIWGKIVYYQTITFYFSTIVNFGFNTTGSREITIQIDNLKERNKSASNIFYLKTLITFLILFIYVSFISINNFSLDSKLLLFSGWNIIFELSFPLWFFQGINKLKYLTFGNSLFKIIISISIFVFIKVPSDYLLYPILNMIGSILIGVWSFSIMKKEKFEFEGTSIHELKGLLKKSYIMAIANFSNSIKLTLNVFFIKAFLGFNEISYYDIASKIINIINNLFDQISQAIFPILSKKFDINLFDKILKSSILISFLVFTLIELFAPNLILLMSGQNINEGVLVLRILAISIPFYIISALYGRNCLIIFNKDKKVLQSMVYSTAVYLIIIIFTQLINTKYMLILISTSLVFSVIFESIFRYQASKKILQNEKNNN